MPTHTSLPARLSAALRFTPNRKNLTACLVEFLWLLPVFAAALLLSSSMNWHPNFDANLIRLAAITIVVPALGEELLFRMAFLPMPKKTAPFPWPAALLSLIAFILWHPLQALIFGGLRGQIFTDPWFLVCVAALGWACTRLYWKTGSIWPPTILHWLTVIGWKGLAGGPALI